jgi:hypothetical protein
VLIEHDGQRLPADGMVPIGWVAVGDPAQAFPGTVFGLERPEEGSLQSLHPEITRRYADLFGRHREDRPL